LPCYLFYHLLNVASLKMPIRRKHRCKVMDI
jgi:hypothetical protein